MSEKLEKIVGMLEELAVAIDKNVRRKPYRSENGGFVDVCSFVACREGDCDESSERLRMCEGFLDSYLDKNDVWAVYVG